MNQAEKRYLSLVSSLGCIVCQGLAEIHHIRIGQYVGQRAKNHLVIPLCPDCHRGTAYHGQSIHYGQQEFEGKHGTEQELLAKTIQGVVSMLDKQAVPF